MSTPEEEREQQDVERAESVQTTATGRDTKEVDDGARWREAFTRAVSGGWVVSSGP